MAAPLTPIDEALARLLADLPRCQDSQPAELLQAVGRVLTRDVHALTNVPPADNSAMDGFAVRAAEAARVPCRLPVSQRIPAGRVGAPLAPGTAARIFTGATLPPGADAVVMQENCQWDDDSVTILQAPARGESVRFAGEDVRRGTCLFARGHRLRMTDLDNLAAAGCAAVEVCRPLRVALLSTGDELVKPGQELGPGQIYNANFYPLAALLQSLGMEVLDLGIIADDPRITRRALQDAAATTDCVISSGGVSVGEADHVRDAVQALGSLDLWRLAIKPGKPFAYGRVAGRPFFGLPGNPVSAFVTFLLLVRPALLTMSGAAQVAPLTLRLGAGFEAGRSGDRQEYLRVSVHTTDSGESRLIPYNSQGSAISASLSQSDGLAIVPPATVVQVGDLLTFMPFSALLH
ncbi:MAG: hypothetical protein RLZZ385_583 [Pseudomonadota bacterium]